MPRYLTLNRPARVVESVSGALAMARRTRYLGVSRGGSATGAAWAAAKPKAQQGDDHYLFISRPGNESGVEVAKYGFDEDSLQEEVSVFHTEEPPQKMAVHPCGDGIICSFSKNCRLIEADFAGIVELKFSERDLPALQNIGSQNNLIFSVDGSRVALGGKDGHLRVFEWPSLKTIIDEPNAHKSVKDLDFSLDGALLASTSDDGPCRIWDLEKGASLTSLHRDKAERFGFCRFSRNGAHPFLFVTVNKDRKGLIAVWEIANWSRLGSKQFQEEEISAFATSCDGKRLAIGTNRGDIAVIEVKKMDLQQQVRSAHIAQVTYVEFSANSRALLSVSSDSTVRVTATRVAAPWKDWQIYGLLLGLILMSALLFYIFFEYSDSFWNFPLGKNQAARPFLKAILGDPVSEDATGW